MTQTTRRTWIYILAAALVALVLGACTAPAQPTATPTTAVPAQATQAPQASTDPILIGVSGPLTGDLA